MKKLGDYDPFFDFFMFQSKRWVAVKKNVTIPKLVEIFKQEIFLIIRKNRNSLDIKGAEKKRPWVNIFSSFFLPYYGNANYYAIGDKTFSSKNVYF
jgi:hypothetical protein